MLTYPFDDYGIINRISNVTIDHRGPANIRNWCPETEKILDVLDRGIAFFFISVYFTQLRFFSYSVELIRHFFLFLPKCCACTSIFQKWKSPRFIKISQNTTYKILCGLIQLRVNIKVRLSEIKFFWFSNKLKDEVHFLSLYTCRHVVFLKQNTCVLFVKIYLILQRLVF